MKEKTEVSKGVRAVVLTAETRTKLVSRSLQAKASLKGDGDTALCGLNQSYPHSQAVNTP